MVDRSGRSNRRRFPKRKKDGKHLCRVCNCILEGRKTSFCGIRCLRDFFMLTDWNRVRGVIWVRDAGICMKCGQVLFPDNFHVDHIVPVSKGGDEWDLSNLELSCPKCNLAKGAKEE